MHHVVFPQYLAVRTKTGRTSLQKWNFFATFQWQLKLRLWRSPPVQRIYGTANLIWNSTPWSVRGYCLYVESAQMIFDISLKKGNICRLTKSLAMDSINYEIPVTKICFVCLTTTFIVSVFSGNCTLWAFTM